MFYIRIVWTQAFFVTPVGEKLKLKKKNLNCWEDFTSSLENSRKKQKLPLKDQNFLKDGTFYVIIMSEQ